MLGGVVYYHVTPEANVKRILRQGIRYQTKPSGGRGMLGQDIRCAQAIFAFTTLYDAECWAIRIGWQGNTKPFIIRFNPHADGVWHIDTHNESRGRWVYSYFGVMPQNILSAREFKGPTVIEQEQSNEVEKGIY